MSRRFTSLIMAVALILICASVVFAGNSASETEQPTLDAKQAQEALHTVLPDIQVISIEPSKLPGIWEVAFKSRGDKGIVYIDETKQYIVVGSLIGLGTGINYTKKKFEVINTVDFSSIPLENSVILGNPDAKTKVVVFDDPD